ncbi:2'-5' RNA ligase family protein [Nocardia sp. KC 131]|uniref:2'-5' RNA ligase family protein n=1 Tax=Nocardia arseniciresistens TaxID=3392119 RepID=UPI00398E39CB
MSATSKSPFPLLQPASTFEADAITGNDWSAFCNLPTLHDHWTMKPWSPGQAGYYWYITFDDRRLRDLVAQCQATLAHDGIDPVPLDGLHLTLLNVGKVDKVSADQLSGVVTAVRASMAEVKPFDLSVGPLAGSRSAVRFSVTPWDALLDVHQRVREATAAYQPSSRLAQTSEFRPHLGVGYINRTQGAAPLIEDVAALRDLPAAEVRIDAIHLVELRRHGRQYRWDDRAVVALGG